MHFFGFLMPNPIVPGFSAADGVHASNPDKAASASKSTGTKVAQAAQRLGKQLKEAMTKFSSSSPAQGNASPLGPAIQHLQKQHPNTMVLQKVDSELPVTKQLMALNALTPVRRLNAIMRDSLWSESGDVNLSFIEHFCGLRDHAAKVSPDVHLRPAEGQTALLAPHNDFVLGVMANEILLIDSMLSDIQQNDIYDVIPKNSYNAIAQISRNLKAGANLMSSISRHALLYVQRNNPNAVSNAAHVCLNSVKELPAGEKLLIPLEFISLGSGEPKSAGHGTYMVVEKNWNDSVNLHMVNRGAGNGAHQVKPGELRVPGQHPKSESAVSKWNVPIGVTGGFSHNFLLKTLMLTLDAQVPPGGRGVVQSVHANPLRQMSKNIAEFYRELGMRTGSAPPSGYQPIYQRPQKDGNCAYSNLKASIRYLLNDSKMYNEIDLLKTEKVARLTVKYMKQNLLQKSNLDTALLNRFQFNAEGAVEKLVAKHEKAEHRVNLDNCAAMPLNLPKHLKNVTN